MTYNGKFSEPAPVPPTYDFFPNLNGVVTVENCYYYLAFLERFWTFMDTMSLQEQRHYLARAEVRYEKWIHNHFSPMLVPPLDIAFMWHVHKLSPFRCYEDLVLRLPCKKLFDDPLPLYDLFKNEDLTPNDLKRWKQTFGDDEPYCLTSQNMYSGTYQRPCYRCQQMIELPWPNYYDYRFGANHTRFPHSCVPDDGINFWDVARMKIESDLTNGLVAGTLLNPDGTEKVTPNKMVAKVKPIQVIVPQNEMDRAYERQIQEQLRFLGSDYEYDANELLYAIRTSYQGNPSPFSIDLIQAVARQRKFYFDIMSIHWQRPISYIAAVRRYHDHLALIKKHPNVKAIPTLEIDVAFHTHMMHSRTYRNFTLTQLEKVINHDDDIPESSIKEHLREWQTVWSNQNLRHPSIEHRYRFTETRATDELVEGTLKVTPAVFPTEYQPGMVRIHQGREARKLYTTLNEELVRSNNTKAAMVSIHSKDVSYSFSMFDDQLDMKNLQEFVAEGMKNNPYGYIGSVNYISGGESVLLAKGKSKASTIVTTNGSNDKGKWLSIGKDHQSSGTSSSFTGTNGFKLSKSSVSAHSSSTSTNPDPPTYNATHRGQYPPAYQSIDDLYIRYYVFLYASGGPPKAQAGPLAAFVGSF